MQILFVSPRQCWPAVSGAKLREYHLARALGERSSLTYVFFREPLFDLPEKKDLPFCEDIVPVPPPRFYSPGRVLRGLIGRWPLPVLNYTSAAMEQAIRRLITARRFDAAHLDSIHMAGYTPLLRSFLPAPRLFFNWHNIESEGMQRYATLTSTSLLKSLYARLTARRLASVESNLVTAGYGNVVCSERERKQLSSITPHARIAVVENGVDTGQFQHIAPAGKRHRILFVGLMAYHANIDAILWFVRTVWPGLRERFPDKTLTIVGAKPVPAVLALREEPGIEVTGTVSDVRPFYAEAFVAVAPLRTGAGTRLKILEAMAAGVPVISTALGAEGLDIVPGENILIANTPEEWIETMPLLTDEAFRRRLTEAGRQLVCSRYDWQIIGASLFNTYSRWLTEAS